MARMLSVARRTRQEAKQDTRDRLLEAARRVFLREGFHRASVDMIAAEAGFTKGAVYSAFASKADIFLATYQERTAARIASLEKRIAAISGPVVAGEVARAWAETLRRDRAWHLVLIEFWVFAARDAAIRTRFAALHAQTRRAFARTVSDALRRRGLPERFDAEAVTRAHMALGNGFALEGFLEPDVVAGTIYEDAARALDRSWIPEAEAAPAGRDPGASRKARR